MSLAVHHIGINVSDLGRSVAFYERLGFERLSVIPAAAGLEIAFLSLGTLHVELFMHTEEELRATPREDATLGFRHLALATGDIEADAAALKADGVIPAETPIRDLPNGMRLLFFTDPDGVPLELVQPG